MGPSVHPRDQVGCLSPEGQAGPLLYPMPRLHKALGRFHYRTGEVGLPQVTCGVQTPVLGQTSCDFSCSYSASFVAPDLTFSLPELRCSQHWPGGLFSPHGLFLTK